MNALLKRIVFTVLTLLAGCSVNVPGIGKVGTRTEAYTAFHKVPVVEHPSTPVEWQAKANSECVDRLMGWRLPDSNLGWKHSRGMTMCVFSFKYNECLCEGPRAISPIQQNDIAEVRFSTVDGTGRVR